MRSVILACAIVTFVTTASAHSHLAYPLPTRRLDCRVGNKRKESCHGPCPPLNMYGDPTGVGPNRPAAAWQRGGRQTIKWHRNNHVGESGFVRLSLVPVSKMLDKRAHDRYTIYETCWGVGLHRCSSRLKRVCGNDGDGLAFQVQITVPTCYPDGVYVFGWAWYGGGNFRDQSFFGDYYSCSFVRIHGGVRVTSEWSPKFISVPGHPNDGCRSATDHLGVCAREPCHIGAVRPMRAKSLPNAIYAREFGGPGKGGAPNHKSGNVNKVSTAGQNGGGGGFHVFGLQSINIQTRHTRNFDGNNLRIVQNSYKNGFTFALRTTGKVVSVRFEGPNYAHTEFRAPFIINGNNGKLNPFHICQGRNFVNIRCTVRGISLTKEYGFNIKCD